MIPVPGTAVPLSFAERLGGPLLRDRLDTLQVNLGHHCNLACSHCHVEAGPNRPERMSLETGERLLDWLSANPVGCLDLTGGAPELQPPFRRLVAGARRLGMRIIDRCNLTVLFVPGQEDLAAFLAQYHVEVTASLPCYSAANVDRQRGSGVFDESIRALRLLNDLGYGQGGELVLNLVYNPVGAHLPPSQSQLEADYKRILADDFGIAFDHLLTITNMPIRRFRHYLEVSGQAERYQQLLVNHYNPDTLPALMCRSLVSIDWEGRLYDCDFNQMLDLVMPGMADRYLWEVGAADLCHRPIAVDEHCYGCTAGAGSSCGGALS